MDEMRLTVCAFILVAIAGCDTPKNPSSVVVDDSSIAQKACVGTPIPNQFVVKWIDGSYTIEQGGTLEDFKKDFIAPNLQNIELVTENRKISLPEAPVQLGINSASSDLWPLEIIEAAAVWEQGYTGKNVLVGVVDTPVDITHPLLKDHIAAGEGNHNYVTSLPSQAPHASHVSGIIAGTAMGNFGGGVAPGAKIIPSAFIDSSGSGDIGNAILAMQYVAGQGARVINASWGGVNCNSGLQDAFRTLERQGVMIITAAGNNHLDLDASPNFPAAFNMSNQINIAASTENDFLADFSNSGYKNVNIAAPGTNILSACAVGYKDSRGNSLCLNSNRSLIYMDGTSMAAPFVTGSVAVLWGAYPNATLAQVRSAILKGAAVIPGHAFRVSTGGRLNLRMALEELKKMMQ